MQRLGRVFDNRCASAIADYMERVVGKIKKKSKRLVGFSIFSVDNRLKSQTKHPRSHMQNAIIE
jgi:nucleoid DNA-binding protein